MLPVLCLPDRLPLTPNRKLDRHALPDPCAMSISREEAPQVFIDPIEQALAAMWTDILKVPQISISDNFFDLGGHSLLATQMVARLEKELGLRMRPKELAFQTLGQFAASCRERLQGQ